MIGNIMIRIRAGLRKEMNDIADTIATGGCNDYANYQRRVGQIDGLAMAERVILDAEEQLRKVLGDDDPESN